jgi:hypothetical protein
MVKIELLTEREEGLYQDFLSKCKYGSIQYSLDWRNVICDQGKDEPFFVLAKQNDEIVGVLPLYYYRSKLGNLLTTIAWHTITGIMSTKTGFDEETERVTYRALLNYSIVLARELDCAALSIATNPFLDDERYYSEYFEADFSMENFVQYIDLYEIFDRQGTPIHPNYVGRTNLSRNLKKAELCKTIVSDEATKNNLEEYFRIYLKRMRELQANPVPNELFDSIQKNLVSKGKGKFVFAHNQGKIISAALVLFNDRIMDVYMMCMDSEHKELRSNYLITYHILKWAKLNGISILNWQSAPGRGDGVYRWKEQWGSRERTFQYLTKIFGDTNQWKDMDQRKLREAYSFHYLLPFNLLKGDKKSTNKSELSRFIIAP